MRYTQFAKLFEMGPVQVLMTKIYDPSEDAYVITIQTHAAGFMRTKKESYKNLEDAEITFDQFDRHDAKLECKELLEYLKLTHGL